MPRCRRRSGKERSRRAPAQGAGVGAAAGQAARAGTLSQPGLVAARDGDEVALGELLQGGGFRPFGKESLDRNGASALDWAAGGGHLGCVKLLLPYTQGVALCRQDGRGPAHWACRHGHLHVLDALHEHGLAHVESRTADGTSMLMLACYGGHLAVARRLLELGASLTAAGWAKHTTLAQYLCVVFGWRGTDELGHDTHTTGCACRCQRGHVSSQRGLIVRVDSDF